MFVARTPNLIKKSSGWSLLPLLPLLFLQSRGGNLQRKLTCGRLIPTLNKCFLGFDFTVKKPHYIPFDESQNLFSKSQVPQLTSNKNSPVLQNYFQNLIILSKLEALTRVSERNSIRANPSRSEICSRAIPYQSELIRNAF